MVSSRPHVTVHLRKHINCQVEILGFSEEDQQHFIEHSLKNQPAKISVLKQYLKQHINIKNLCFIPFNMTIFYSYSRIKKKGLFLLLPLICTTCSFALPSIPILPSLISILRKRSKILIACHNPTIKL